MQRTLGTQLCVEEKFGILYDQIKLRYNSFPKEEIAHKALSEMYSGVLLNTQEYVQQHPAYTHLVDAMKRVHVEWSFVSIHAAKIMEDGKPIFPYSTD